MGSRAPKGRVPVIRPRRDRIMGSSILASLSEAGGNDPFLPMAGPLPSHPPVGADRVGTRPTPYPMQTHCLSLPAHQASALSRFQQLSGAASSLLLSSKSISGTPVPHRLCTSACLRFLALRFTRPLLSGHTLDRNLSPARLCLIMKTSQRHK